jgi:serine/threonine-protein kinase
MPSREPEGTMIARPRYTAALLLVGALAGTLAIALHEISAFAWLEQRTVETRFDIRGERAPSPEVVVVALDTESIRLLDDQPPVARATQAKVVDNLRRAGARVVAFDFTLEQPSEDAAGDRDLARALARTRAAVVGVTTIRSGARVQPLVGRRPFDGSRVRPGHIWVPLDSDDAVRRFAAPYNGVPPMATLAAMLHEGRTELVAPPDRALIDYPGPPGTVPGLRFTDVLSHRFDPSAVRDRTVVIGPTAPLLQDSHPTAVGGGPMPGPEIQANSIATALAGYPLRATSPVAVAALMLLLAGAVTLSLWLRARRVRPGAASIALAGALTLVAWTVATQLAFEAGNVVDYSAGVFAILVACAGAATLVAIAGRAERADVRALFAAYSPAVVRRVLAQDAPLPGGLTRSEIITGFRIEEEIGAGGMGVVYRAVDVRLDREVALKLIRPQYALRPLFRARFKRETRAAALIGHPHIVPVFDGGEDDGLLYIAMMLVDGVDLARTIDVFGPLEHEMLATLMRQIASALDAAHAHGLVHRDVKPANVLLTFDPYHAYLTDFGIAKQIDGDDGLTEPGGWVGTVDYLAPEIADGQDASALSDIYALAGMLFYCVTGHVPFDLPSEAAKLRAHADATPPSVLMAAPDAPPGLDAVIARGMAKRPEDRYASGSELAEAAARALGFARAVTHAAATTPVPRDVDLAGAEPTQ